MISSFIQKIRGGDSLSAEEIGTAFSAIFNGEVSDADAREFLIALHDKGETAQELVGAARFLRSAQVPVRAFPEAFDCCGTGGDQKGTFNVSTAVAFILAGGGVRVAKHGNRAVSSLSGSADVLGALGVKTDLSPAEAVRCFESCGIVFLFAPLYYPGLAKVAALRKSIPHRTIFNLLGPLINPMGAQNQLLGVFDRKFVPVMAQAFLELGGRSAVVVSSDDGLDEFSLSSKATLCRVSNGTVTAQSFNPWQETGYKTCTMADLRGTTPEANALRLRRVLKGHAEPLDHVVHVNAAWGFVVAGKAATFMDGLLLAQESVSSGKAYQKLEALTAYPHPA